MPSAIKEAFRRISLRRDDLPPRRDRRARLRELAGGNGLADPAKTRALQETDLPTVQSEDDSPALREWRRRQNVRAATALVRAAPAVLEWMNRHSHWSGTGPTSPPAPPAELRPELELKENQGVSDLSSFPGSRPLTASRPNPSPCVPWLNLMPKAAAMPW